MHFSLLGLLGAGVLTFASPCILPVIPVYLSLLAGASLQDVKAGAHGRRLFAAAAAFVTGLALVFVLLGMGATAAGKLLAAHRTAVMVTGGVVTALFGLRFLGVLRIRWLENDVRPGLSHAPSPRDGSLVGLLQAMLFGAAFAAGWSPCIGPVLASVLTYTASATSKPMVGALYLGVYAAGLALPLLAVAAVAPSALALLARARHLIPRLEKVTGLAMIGVGAWMLWSARPVPSAASVNAPAVATIGEGAAPCPSGSGSGVACAVDVRGAKGVAPGLPAGPVMIEFVGAHCPICTRMAPVLAKAEQQCQGVGGKMLKVDVGTAQGAALARDHRVVGTPTFVFLDATGAEVGRLLGEQPLEELASSLQLTFGPMCAIATTTHPSAG